MSAADDACRSSPDQFQDVRVLLLRHDAAAGTNRIRQCQEAKLLGAPENPLLGPASQMLGDQGENEDRLERKIAVAGNIQTIGPHRLEPQLVGHEIAVDRKAGASQGSRA